MIHPITAPIEAPYREPTLRTPGRYEGLMRFAQKLAGLFGSAMKTWTILDVGGADGWLGELLVCRRYWWIDPRADWGPPRWLGTLTETAAHALFRPHHPLVGVAEALAVATASVDLVVSKQTLPHFTQPILACREMLRVAREAVVIRQDWGFKDTQGGYQPIGWAGHSRSRIDHPDDILEVLTARGVSTATYDGEDFVARRIR